MPWFSSISIILSIALQFLELIDCTRNVVNVLDFRSQTLPYSTTWNWQLDIMQHHLAQQDFIQKESDYNRCVGSVIICQHKSVYTLGTATTDGSGPFSKRMSDGSMLEYETFQVERAGQATYHGPGQIVMYPILDLNSFDRDIHLYLRRLEQVIIDTLKGFDIESTRVPGLTGVWVENSKIAAIGIKLRRWVTMHGLSLNVNPDMRYFKNIVPCGISDKPVSSISQFYPSITLDTAADMLLNSFCKEFDVDVNYLDAAKADTFIEDITTQYSSLRA